MPEQGLNIQFEASRIRWSRSDEQMKDWFTRKQRSINWMCSPLVEWLSAAEVRKRGSVCPARKIYEEEIERAFSSPFILPGKVIRAEWDKSSSLVENMKSTVKIINALNNNLLYIIFMFHSFLVLKQGPSIYLSFCFPWVSPCDPPVHCSLFL